MAGISSSSARLSPSPQQTRTSSSAPAKPATTPAKPATVQTKSATPAKTSAPAARDSFETTRTQQRPSVAPAKAPTSPAVTTVRMRDEDLPTTPPSKTSSPDQALAYELFELSQSEALVHDLRRSTASQGKPVDQSPSSRLQQAYAEFRGKRHLTDSPDAQREFILLMDARRAYASRNALPNMGADDERRFLAEAALSRLQARAQLGQPLNIRSGEGWMISALVDPRVTLSQADQKLLERATFESPSGRSTVSSERRDEQLRVAKKEAEFRATPGKPYKATLNAADVFQGDVQRNAFSLAARAGGYSDDEIQLALGQLEQEGSKLYCNQTVQGQPLIMTLEEATAREKVGRQDFVTYSLDKPGAAALHDARNALKQGYATVKDYRMATQNTWATSAGKLGQALLEYEQDQDTAQGKSDHPVLGPLMRGKYDAIREVTQVVTNAIQLGEMAGTELKLFAQTGDLFVRLKDDPEVVRYFDQETERFSNVFDTMAKSYAEKEKDFVSQVARGFVANIPKAMMGLIPGGSAGLGYTLLKDFHSPGNELAKDLTLDLVSLVTGPLTSSGAARMEGAISRAAPRLVDNPLKQFVVQEVADRGLSSTVGAAQELVTTMVPAELNFYFAKDGPPLSEAEQRKLNESVAGMAYDRALLAGFMNGLLFPSRPTRDMDAALLNAKDNTLEGPVYQTKTADNQSRLYATVKVLDAKGRNHLEVIEVSPDHPRVRAQLTKEPARTLPQVEADTALALSRYRYRLDDKGRKALIQKSNAYAAQKLRLDAKQGELRATPKQLPPKRELKLITTSPEPKLLNPAPPLQLESARPTARPHASSPKPQLHSPKPEPKQLPPKPELKLISTSPEPKLLNPKPEDPPTSGKPPVAPRKSIP
jgi:hypothetical protein